MAWTVETTNSGQGTAKIDFEITYSITQSTTNNTSTITVTNLRYRSAGNYTGSQWTEKLRELQVKFAGVMIARSYGTSTANCASVAATNANTWYSVSNFKANVTSGTIEHDNDGTKSGVFTVSTYISNSYHEENYVGTTSTTKNLPTISRTLTISYNKGAYGTGTNVQDTKEYNVVKKLRGAIFLRSGYKQTGWSINSDGSTKDYELEEDYSNDESITLYPYWEISTIVRISDGTTIKEYTNLYFSDGNNVYNIIGCYYSDGTSTHQGI